eukprot:m.194172 g.194172  ORF g.194172 m.194172 type:complete len:252 (+) comp25791_c0_seq3:377-1132(+)
MSSILLFASCLVGRPSKSSLTLILELSCQLSFHAKTSTWMRCTPRLYCVYVCECLDADLDPNSYVFLYLSFRVSYPIPHFVFPHQVWEFLGLEMSASKTDPADSSSNKEYCIIDITIKLRRRPTFYIYNVAIPMFFLTTMSACSWSIDREDIPSRLSVTLTLLLTAVAYKIVISSELPAVSYVTALDSYILTCTGFLALVVLQNTLSGTVDTTPFETWSAIFITILWVCYHLYLYVTSWTCCKKPVPTTLD